MGTFALMLGLAAWSSAMLASALSIGWPMLHLEDASEATNAPVSVVAIVAAVALAALALRSSRSSRSRLRRACGLVVLCTTAAFVLQGTAVRRSFAEYESPGMEATYGASRLNNAMIPVGDAVRLAAAPFDRTTAPFTVSLLVLCALGLLYLREPPPVGRGLRGGVDRVRAR